jgi:predicted lipoprotein with Yx(FWY)xxD motif
MAMKTSRTLLAAVALLGLAACSDSKSSTAATTSPGTAAATTVADGSATTTPAAGDATVVLSDSSLGQILTTADGMTLYLFTPDTATSSACTDGCATAWPPLTTAAVGGEGLDAAQFGTLDRGDGTTQVTYYGHPLYLFSGDAAPGDATGQGSGGKWYVVTSEGTAVDE